MKGISDQVLMFVIAIIIVSIILIIAIIFLSGGKTGGEQGLLSAAAQQCCAEYKACIARGGTDCQNINCRFPNGTITSAYTLIKTYSGQYPSDYCK
ncbi:MAG: hypothetical protein QXF15_01575 [Candidatus Aenigmatarchaeota archaeon]|nr:hypothetical protein [Candidatus Aenigmarchaeota archaeon]